VEPLPLTPQEIDQFQLEAQKYGLDSVPDPTLGFTIGDMVEIVEGPYKGERGPIRLVRNGGVTVRLFAYGQWFDLDFKPAVRERGGGEREWKREGIRKRRQELCRCVFCRALILGFYCIDLQEKCQQVPKMANTKAMCSFF